MFIGPFSIYWLLRGAMPGQGRLGDKANVPLDTHGCPACPHPAIGPAIQGSPDVNVNRRPALRVDDRGMHAAYCGTNTWTATKGSLTVFINGKGAHRQGDLNKHCGGLGQLVEGSPNVIVGESGGGGGGSGGGGGGGGGSRLGGGGSGGSGMAGGRLETRGNGGGGSSNSAESAVGAGGAGRAGQGAGFGAASGGGASSRPETGRHDLEPNAATAGGPDHNLRLSVDRADAIGAYLRDDVTAWDAWFAAEKPKSTRWGTREIQHMLTVLPEDLEDGPKFYRERVHGYYDDHTRQAVMRFQQWSNDKNGTFLQVDGIAGQATRPEIVRAYMNLDGTTLPAGTNLVTHGCGENHLDVETGDATANAENRRVDLFVFEGPIDPPPPGKTSRKTDPQYNEWKARSIETTDVSADPADDELGIIFMELFDKLGVDPIAGRPYEIVPANPEGTPLRGATGADGGLRHERVEPDDWVLRITGVDEAAAAIVLDRGSVPQQRFLEINESES